MDLPGRSAVDNRIALVVDRDASVRALLRDVLERDGILAVGAASAVDALDTLKAKPVSILLVDTSHGGPASLELLRHGQRLSPSPVTVALVEPADSGTSHELMREGVDDVLVKPLDAHQVELLVHRAGRQLELADAIRRVQHDLQSREGYHGLVGRSPSMERLRQSLRRLAASDVPVWLTGPSGSGKGLIAAMLHETSSRRERPFVVEECRNVGSSGLSAWLSRAEGGTLYLAGLPHLDPVAQEQLLDAIGGPRPSDVRLMAGADRDPEGSVTSGRVLPELARRLGGEQLVLEPLSARIEDIPLLARYFIETITEINRLPQIRLSPEALHLLENYRWPGQVQELRNAIEHAVILAGDGTIGAGELPERIREPGSADVSVGATNFASTRFKEAKQTVVSRFERAYLGDLLERHSGNVTSASQQAGMLRSALQRLLRKYGLKSADYRMRRSSASAAATPDPG